MSSQFQAVPDNIGGILNIGPVAVGIDNANLRAFVDAVEAVEAIRRTNSSNLPLAKDDLLRGTDWGPIGYISERGVYNFRYRGVVWEASPVVVMEAATAVKEYFVSLKSLTQE